VEKFTVHTGRVAPLRRSDVDTDQIIPAVWLKQVSRTGFGAGLFSAWREADPGFVLNRPEYAGVSVLVAGPDFGTGSSREHAVWALQDFGFRVVLSPRFGDIFRGNSLKAGLLTVVVGEELVEQLWARAEADPRSELTVDLAARELRFDDRVVPFELDDFTRWRLLNGLDDVARRPAFLPTTLPV
jgi:3-isopropylmalate/(R)-2-methylmalate dehydratase small subunit